MTSSFGLVVAFVNYGRLRQWSDRVEKKMQACRERKENQRYDRGRRERVEGGRRRRSQVRHWGGLAKISA
jgi:hypothetical protein